MPHKKPKTGGIWRRRISPFISCSRNTLWLALRTSYMRAFTGRTSLVKRAGDCQPSSFSLFHVPDRSTLLIVHRHKATSSRKWCRECHHRGCVVKPLASGRFLTLQCASPQFYPVLFYSSDDEDQKRRLTEHPTLHPSLGWS